MKSTEPAFLGCPGCKKRICDGCRIFDQLNTNKQTPVRFPFSFSPQKQEGLGISFDMGTTTLAGMLWDLESAALLEVETMKNPQVQVGADVISRIQYALESEQNLKQLQTMMVSSLDVMAKKLLARLENRRTIQKVVLAGNTPMCELLLGLCPAGIAQMPFSPDYQGTVRSRGAELGLKTIKDAEVIVLPPIGGYVGSDALSVYHSLRAQQGIFVAVDIGTNGEILLQCGDQKLACSAAAGPALEGGAVSRGMRAVKGAVEKIGVFGNFPMQDIVCKVIGGGKPEGICGSGLIDAVAVLYRLGVIDRTGYLRTAREARAAGVPGKVCARLEAGQRILLTSQEHPVYLGAEDIRQLQLAIGAIRTGMELLLARAGITWAEISRFYIAGAFGSYIDIKSGKMVGLFPDIPEEKIIQAGNLASTGAAMALLSETELRKMEGSAGEIFHVELAGDKDFETMFLKHMEFPVMIK